MKDLQKPLILIITALSLAILGVFNLLPEDKTLTIDFRDIELKAYADQDDYPLPDSLGSAASVGSLEYSNVHVLKLDSHSQSLEFISELKKKHPWPYVGFTMVIGDTLTGEDCLDASEYEFIDLTLNSSNAVGFHTQTFGFIPQDSRQNPQEILRMAQTTVPVNTVTQTYSVKLSSISVPLWWKKSMNLSLLDNHQYHEKVCKLGLSQSMDFLHRPGIDTLKLYKMSLRGVQDGNYLAGFILLGIALVLLIAAILKPESFGVIAHTQAAQIELKDSQNELYQRIQSWYEQNYMTEADSTQEFAHQIGIHPKKLQETLRNHFQITHKAWLNHLRIEEAKRLLIESNALIGDIADAVGFRTLSHFNRVFKEKVQLSPADYRNQNNHKES